MRDILPVGYELICKGDRPRTIKLVPPIKPRPVEFHGSNKPGEPARVTYEMSREDLFFELAAGDEYTVRMMRPDEVSEHMARGDAGMSPEAVAACPGQSEFTATMLQSMGLTCRVIRNTAEHPGRRTGTEVAG